MPTAPAWTAFAPGALPSGRCFNVSLDSASSDHERNALVIDSHGRIVTLAQIAGFVARRILCHVKPGDTLMRGQRFGFIRFLFPVSTSTCRPMRF